MMAAGVGRSPLSDQLARFLDFKRAAGYRYREEARVLDELDRFLATHLSPDDPVITDRVVRDFVACRASESETTRSHRLTLIRQVCRFLALEEPRTSVPGPRFLGIHRRGFVPRVLTRNEGRLFLDACPTLAPSPWSPFRGLVLGTALQVLYLTGMRAGELLRLTRADVDLSAAVLRLRDTKFGKSRSVPLALDLGRRLGEYEGQMARRLASWPPDAPFFPNRAGRAYSITTLRAAFRQVLGVAGVAPVSAGRRLRLHDLRHSFAVLRLLLWYEHGVDLDAKLPLLATYLGHVGLASSQRYLQLTEELASEVTRRHQARFGHLIVEGGRP
jgi:integrase/recombinase XerD